MYSERGSVVGRRSLESACYCPAVPIDTHRGQAAGPTCFYFIDFGPDLPNVEIRYVAYKGQAESDEALKRYECEALFMAPP